jgi:hypothetical protein
MARLTYKKLAVIVSEKLHSAEFKHDTVEVYNPRHRGDDIEAGACLIIFKVNKKDNYTTLHGFQWRIEIEKIINTGNYSIEINLQNRFTLSDAEIRFIKN